MTVRQLHYGGTAADKARVFLFLQGPHGSFFGQLARKLDKAGCTVARIALNRGDNVFWPSGLPCLDYAGGIEEWAEFLKEYMQSQGVTDIVLYGDARPYHKAARSLALAGGITVHCFEEGYLRPYWATYERGGVNGHSDLMDISIDRMQSAIGKTDVPQRAAPPLWGAIWHHAFYGFLYHFLVALPSRRFAGYSPHRDRTIPAELMLYARRMTVMPLHGVLRRWRTARLLRRGDGYFLVLLQLSHDASLKVHGGFANNRAFITRCITEFANHAPAHARLVFKAHPFEDYREPVGRIVREVALQRGVVDRVDFLPGGKLGPLLDGAKAAITVNSTAAQQALWRNLPVLALGRSVFAREGLVAQQDFGAFFRAPAAPDAARYAVFRQFLLETSQLPGGFYTRKGRAVLLRRAVEAVLRDTDPYQRRLNGAGFADETLRSNN